MNLVHFLAQNWLLWPVLLLAAQAVVRTSTCGGWIVHLPLTFASLGCTGGVAVWLLVKHQWTTNASLFLGISAVLGAGLLVSRWYPRSTDGQLRHRIRLLDEETGETPHQRPL